jgi:hypothetical protein
VFGIVTAADFKAKAGRDNAALQSDFANADLMINAVLSAYHLHEWVWRLVLKPMKPIQIRGEMLRSKADWVAWLACNCPYFELVQDLANGSKHCLPVDGTGKIAGFGSGPFGIGPYGRSYLLIDLGEELGSDRRWLVGHQVVAEINKFWVDLGKEQAF